MFRLPSVDRLDDSTSQLFTIPEYRSITGFKFNRAGLEGSIVGYTEYTAPSEFSTKTSKNSLSITREASSKADAIRGRPGYMPFAPGGASTMEENQKPEKVSRDSNGLYDVAPGLSRGLLEELDQEEAGLDEGDLVDIEERDLDEDIVEDISEGLEDVAIGSSDQQLTSMIHSSEIDDLLPSEITFGRIQNNIEAIPRAKDWAHVVDINKTISNFRELVPSMAKEFPFELDTFQKEAVYHLEQGDSVFVAAHTSAGKTVVAEYAIAMASRNMTKAIYTSPIKALSNQKFRDFKEIFDDVGILTGDVQINAEASCLIMTTEILRSMLYRGADLIRDVEFVIFDEVHYVNDQDRGVVWEEVIIMLPEHIKLILLSATVPNTFEFANWVGRTKQKDIYVISTPKRPVPLEHFLWIKNQKIKLVNAEKRFQEDGYAAVNNIFNPPATPTGPKSSKGDQATRGGARGGARGGGRGGRGGRGGGRGGGQLFVPRGQGNGGSNSNRRFNSTHSKTTFLQLLQYLNKQSLLPAVIFVFSQKQASAYASMLTSIDFCTSKEKSEIKMFVNTAISRLRKEDRELPQIGVIRELLMRGIGTHHGGLLPIVKETIEILFAKSLVKVLFATETFAMGLNLPTKTVVFASTRKFDGHNFRSLLPGEYTQMAGRAGRRGLDDTGTVMIMLGDELPSQESFRELILGTPTKLKSQFRLTYNMILNLLRIEALKVEEMIKRSFSENANQVMLPEHQRNVKVKEEALKALKHEPCNFCDVDILDIIPKIEAYSQKSTELYKFFGRFANGLSAFVRNRIIVFKNGDEPRAVGLIHRSDAQGNLGIFVLSRRPSDPSKDIAPFYPMIRGYVGRNMPKQFVLASAFKSITIPVTAVEFITRITTKFAPWILLKSKTQQYKEAIDSLNAIFSYQDSWHEYHKEIRAIEMAIVVKERDRLFLEIAASSCITCPNFNKHFAIENERYKTQQNIENLKQLISSENMELLPDYEQRIDVLKELNYIDEDQNVLLKGRVACEITTGFELIITELILDNFLASYEPEEIVSLLSVFLFQGASGEVSRSITPKLDFGRVKITEVVTKILKVFEAHNVLVTQEEADFFEKDRFILMEPIYEWGRGMSFRDIMYLTSVPEGTIVRVITRLDEVCRQVMGAARIIGDATLYEKMGLAQEKIKRDIVFCASLYL